MSSHLSNDEFLTQLSTLLTSTSQTTHGSVFLTQKPFLYDLPASDSSTTQDDPSPIPILIRATNGNPKLDSSSTAAAATGETKPVFERKKLTKRQREEKRTKLSTVVQPADLEAFFAKYADVAKGAMPGGGMRKRDRTKRKKGKGKGTKS